ncbi:hypothetical protein [Aquimarina spongiae]|uniref:Uncharacterized protein n=1 Tax=Aquimarina spongiae TaxID=570521 RepID=A0A1M6BCZ1_9FLAO|nr:hypothetical protein [Aquimarina spongiae]SHI46614.1 hypothetical protein SAMN04488508_101754 [Aquimarina spongiae]
MTRIIITTLSIFFLISCGKNKEKEEPGLLNVIEGVSDLNQIAKEAEKIEEENDQLIAATPISNENMKKNLPETILGYPRTKFSVGNQFMPDVSMGEAEYESENGAFISLSILDGAGETGSAMVTLARLGFARDFEEQTDRGYRKSTTIKGYKAVEEVEKDPYDNRETSKIDLMVANRFLISLEGDATIKQLREAVGEVNLEAFENLAE